jgi:hypothetical protein
MMAADGELGPLRQRLQVAPTDQRWLALVRGGSAALAALGSLALLAADVPVPVFLAALLGLLMSLLWIGQARRALRVARTVETHHLSIYRDGFVVAEGQRVTRVPFEQVRELAVDEERLDILVKLSTGESLRLEPRYPGLEIHDLVRTLHEAREQAAHHVGGGTRPEL